MPTSVKNNPAEPGKLNICHGKLNICHGKLNIRHGKLNICHGKLNICHGKLNVCLIENSLPVGQKDVGTGCMDMKISPEYIWFLTH